MNHPHPTRRECLQWGLAATAGAMGLPAHAATYPDHLVHLIVPSAAGGSPDAICRLLTTELAKSLAVAFVIDNRAGASGNIGMSEIVHAANDGYTLGYGNVGTLAINKSLFKKLPYDPLTQLVPVSLLGFVQNALVVRQESKISSVADLIGAAKAKPGTLTMGSAGNGTTGHLSGELFKSMTGTDMVHVPYRGSPAAIADLLGGQIDLMFDNLSSILPQIKAGRLKALAVTGAQQSPLLPGISTVAASGVPGYDVVAWGGIVAPAGTPPAVVGTLNKAINTALSTPAVIEKYAAIGFELTPGPPERLWERAAKETPLWAGVIQRANVHLD